MSRTLSLISMFYLPQRIRLNVASMGASLSSFVSLTFLPVHLFVLILFKAELFVFYFNIVVIVLISSMFIFPLATQHNKKILLCLSLNTSKIIPPSVFPSHYRWRF